MSEVEFLFRAPDGASKELLQIANTLATDAEQLLFYIDEQEREIQRINARISRLENIALGEGATPIALPTRKNRARPRR